MSYCFECRLLLTDLSFGYCLEKYLRYEFMSLLSQFFLHKSYTFYNSKPLKCFIKQLERNEPNVS